MQLLQVHRVIMRKEPATKHADSASAYSPAVIHVPTRQKALEMGRKCRAKFPELAVYSNFVAPRWVTNVGDFRTRQEAHKYVKLIRKAHFTYEVRVVSSEVNLPNY